MNRYIRAQAADFGKIYDAARREITDRLRREAVSVAERGTIPHSARLLAAMEQVYPRLEAAYRERFKEAIPYVAQSAYFMALNDLKLGGREFDADRVKLTLEDAYTHIAGMTANMKKKDVAFLRETVAGVEREAAMTGMTARQVTAELLTRLESRPEGFKFVDAGNRVWDSRAYCEMLARTTLLNTSRQEYLDTCAENGADVVMVTVSGHCCDKCAEWENRLLSISGATKGLPTVEEATAAGLFHPNCTHSLTEVDDYTREEEYNPDGTPKTGGEDEHDEHDHAAAAKPEPKAPETHEEHLARRQEQLETARQNRVQREAKFIGAPLIKGEHTRESDLKTTNPNYSKGTDEWRKNCQRCVVAYEMRRRGIDVESLPRIFDGSDTLPHGIRRGTLNPDGWGSAFKNAKAVYCGSTSGRGTGIKTIQQLEQWGNGARAIVRIQWKDDDGGHRWQCCVFGSAKWRIWVREIF